MSDVPSGYPGAPPGWYNDPAGGPGQRWWDGYAWTEALVQPAPAPPPPPPHWTATPTPSATPTPIPSYARPAAPLNPASAPDLVARELLLTPVARLAFGFFGLYDLVSLINVRLNLSQFRLEGHQLRLMMHAAENGEPAPTFTNTPATFSGLQAIFLLLGIVAVVVACMWQYRAASAARALGQPSTHSPGWGVGSWFVPIVQLWMPYQAVRDCLPPGDPTRALIRNWWLLVLGGQIMNAAAVFAAFSSGAVSLAISIPAAFVALGLLATGPRVVLAISAAHRAAAGGRAT